MARDSEPSGFFIGVAGFLSFSVMAGVLVAAMMTPAIALTSEAANASIGIFDNLPESITLGRLTQQNEVYATRAGEPVQIATTYDQDRRNVGWNDVSTYLKEAAIAGEDRRFYDHGGVDMQAVVRAATDNLEHKAITSGAWIMVCQTNKKLIIRPAPCGP